MRPTDASLTPWARDCLAAAGLTPAGIRALLPEGWRLRGSAKGARGPWTFTLMPLEPGTSPRETTVRRVADVREGIAGLIASVTPDLEKQLAASLAVLGLEEKP